MDQEDKTIEAHKHYRAVGIAVGAALIALSLIQLDKLASILAEDGSIKVTIFDFLGSKFRLAWPVYLASVFGLIATIFVCVFQHFLIFMGYFFEARRDQRIANLKYFSPADKLIVVSFLLFLLSSALSILFITNTNWAWLLIVSIFLFGLIFYSWNFIADVGFGDQHRERSFSGKLKISLVVIGILLNTAACVVLASPTLISDKEIIERTDIIQDLNAQLRDNYQKERKANRIGLASVILGNILLVSAAFIPEALNSKEK